MTTSTEQLTDEALVARIRAVQAEMDSLSARMEELYDEISTRKNLHRESRDRWMDLNEELYNLVAPPQYPMFTP